MELPDPLSLESPAAGAGDESLRYATVLVELGDLRDAEIVIAGALEKQPEDLTALDLLAKVNHMRGQLSAAIACWAQVHAKSHPGETALMRLSSLLQLARQEQSDRRFMVLGPFQLWRKPAAHLELEEVFRLFLARRPDEARERCEQLARKYAGKEADLYKLAVMARSWIAEMSGDFEGARAVLEQLGTERGFETDDDRILALARLYERIGAPDLLENAIHIYRHCEHTSKASRSWGTWRLCTADWGTPTKPEGTNVGFSRSSASACTVPRSPRWRPPRPGATCL